MANNFFGNLNPDLLATISNGLLTGKSTAEQFGNVVTGVGQYRKDQQYRNRTMELLGSENPELVQAVEAGLMTPGDAFTLHFKQKQETQKAQRPDRSFQTLPNGDYGFFDEGAGSWTLLAPRQRVVRRTRQSTA